MKDQILIKNIKSQILASLYMLKSCIDRCPDSEWHERHNDYPFSQIVVHTLFDCDFILCDSEKELKEQKYHKDNKVLFSDYEELKDRIPSKQYERSIVNQYYEFCISKVESIPNNKKNLIKPKSDITKTMTKIERYINGIRHIQHHAAQLGFQLQQLTGKEMEWIGRGTSE